MTINRIPDDIFFPVTMVRDINKAVIHRYKDIAKGTPEVELVSSLGFKRNITKKELVENYRLVNNSKIRMVGMTCDKAIIVVGVNQGMEMTAAYIPTNCTVETDRQKISDKYIVCELDSNGYPDKNKHYVMSKSMFRKIFSMSGSFNDILEKYSKKQRGYEEESAEKQDRQERFNAVYKPSSYSPMNQTPNQSLNSDNSNKENKSKRENKYSIISKVVDKNKKVTGIKLKDKDTGEVVKVSMVFLPNYIKDEGVDGLTLEYKEDGTPVVKVIVKNSQE